MVVQSFSNWISRWKEACARQFERPHESPVRDFTERVMWKDLVVMRGIHVAERHTDAAAGDAPTVTRHAVPHCKREAAKASAHLQIQFQTCLSRQLRGHSHHHLQWKAAIIQVVIDLKFLILVVTSVWMWHKLWNRQRNYTGAR